MCCFLGGILFDLFLQMEMYNRVEKPKDETPIAENEIRITSMGRARNYITYAMTLLQVLGFSSVNLKTSVYVTKIWYSYCYELVERVDRF